MRGKLLLIAVILLIATAAAQEHYTYENAERLKPLIEWRDYTPSAFNEAIAENKPIFLLLTAPSWCYWCQVYESEDYLFHPSVVKTINEKFIPIYVDADQRQDLTRQYLEGGWPSTTILTPARERLFGFSGVRPPQNMVTNLNAAAEQVKTSGLFNRLPFNYQKTAQVVPTENWLNRMIEGFEFGIERSYDSQYGGFGTGQKFPQGRTLDFALDLYEKTGEEKWLNLVENTLENQYTKLEDIKTNYNLFDPVEGGFHRYGTQREWSPPHFEKMLYDNARLLKAYYHLLQIKPENELAQEVVEKTLEYIDNNWWDATNGGFYGNTDVHGEEHYYGKNPRPEPKARVEETKYSDWNSDAIISYLYLWQESQNVKYKQMAGQSLDFFASEMVTDKGAYHYYKNGVRSVRGSVLDNSNLLLAFVEGYEVLKKEEYLATAIKLADYSLTELYDWHSGGFFERNSPDLNSYAPGDNIVLSKPTPENGIMALAFLKLYVITENPVYLNAGLKTIGAVSQNAGSLDRGYHFTKAAEFALENGLLDKFVQLQSQIKEVEKTEQENFWVDKLISGEISQQVVEEFELSEEGLETIEGPLPLLILIALLAGFISFASPCSLPILPAYIAYSFRSSKKNIKGLTLAFFLGLSLVFTLLGMSASLIGTILKSQLGVFSQVAGIGIMLIGVLILAGKDLPGIKMKRKDPTSYIGALLFGIVMGISWTPCVGPILVSILLLASTSSSVLTGGILLFFYSVGLAIPLILVSMYIGKINKKNKLWKLIEGKELHFTILKKQFTVHTSSLISGILFLVLGYLIFSGSLIAFNKYVSATSLQKTIFNIEEWLLNLIK